VDAITNIFFFLRMRDDVILDDLIDLGESHVRLYLENGFVDFCEICYVS
jgi:hypothetical protein